MYIGGLASCLVLSLSYRGRDKITASLHTNDLFTMIFMYVKRNIFLFKEVGTDSKTHVVHDKPLSV